MNVKADSRLGGVMGFIGATVLLDELGGQHQAPGGLFPGGGNDFFDAPELEDGLWGEAPFRAPPARPVAADHRL
ncbi:MULTISPECIES: hypothetical protein [Thiorhodovibrio]|uniref:hypothetical protein n=1 Tax=Thiorhodovibrio TaxID=61593 RepID=UPI002B25C112|nr:hypothetical protein [Thiorhodovibrio litoralis]